MQVTGTEVIVILAGLLVWGWVLCPVLDLVGRQGPAVGPARAAQGQHSWTTHKMWSYNPVQKQQTSYLGVASGLKHVLISFLIVTPQKTQKNKQTPNHNGAFFSSLTLWLFWIDLAIPGPHPGWPPSAGVE